MKTMLALTALAGALYVAPATAQSLGTDTVTRVVSYSDLDLRTDKGQRTLDNRLRVAVSMTCGTASSADPLGKREVARCRIDTLDRLSAQRDQVIAAAAALVPTQIASQ